MLDAYKVPEEDIAFITEQVSNLFSDSDVWPEEQLSIWAYYLASYLLTKLALSCTHDCHSHISVSNLLAAFGV